MVLDALEGDLVTKADFALFQEKLENRFVQIDSKFVQIDNRFTHLEERVRHEIKESEFRLTTRLGVLMASITSIAVAVLTWLIKFP